MQQAPLSNVSSFQDEIWNLTSKVIPNNGHFITGYSVTSKKFVLLKWFILELILTRIAYAIVLVRNVKMWNMRSEEPRTNVAWALAKF